MEFIESLTPPKISWKENHLPFNEEYGDVYFSKHGAVEEYRHVFHHGNHLTERWEENPGPFRIGELGFGTAIGFLSTWKAWREFHSEPRPRLHFLSFEKHPWHPDLLRQAWQNDPELQSLGEELLASYPEPVSGIHTLSFSDLKLTLVLGDALSFCKKMLFPRGSLGPHGSYGIDAWFLHGFSPSKNPELWSLELFQELARLSHGKTTFSTFSVASQVRENLQKAGFSVKKAPGVGLKTEILVGHLDSNSHEAVSRLDPGYRSSSPLFTDRSHFLVIGAGLAGAAAAFSLSERGSTVTVLEHSSMLGSGPSGNPAGLIMPFIAAKPDPKCRISLAAFQLAARRLKKMGLDSGLKGVFQIAKIESDAEQWKNALHAMQLPETLACWKDPEAFQTLSKIPNRWGGLHYPCAGSVQPLEICKTLLKQKNIQLRFNSSVDKLTRSETGRWIAWDLNGKILEECDGVVIACSLAAKKLSHTDFLPLTPVRGQLGIYSGRMDSTLPTRPFSAGHYCIPGTKEWVFGATYQRSSTDLTPRPTENQQIWDSLQKILPELPRIDFTAPESAERASRVSLRAYTPDAICIAGPVPDSTLFREQYRGLKRGYPLDRYPDSADLSGVALSAGHGSRGIASSFLAAEVLAAYFYGEWMPLEADLIQALHPARFLIRELCSHK